MTFYNLIEYALIGGFTFAIIIIFMFLMRNKLIELGILKSKKVENEKST